MKKNRRLIQIVIFIGVLLLGGYAIGNALFSKSDGQLSIGSSPPEFALLGNDGKTHRLTDFKGKALVINFWGTFCPGCVTETPDLEAQYKKKGDKPLEIVGINLGEDNLTVNNFVKQYGVSYNILHDENRKVERKYGLKSYPTTFFVKPDGTIMDIFVGPMTEKDIDERVTKLLQS
ncbi:thiol-disulfide oxidoreductase ResA [Paenibacillus baekrokdamisoli]|uniref:Thiol-disulfide oxidoreductase ResA n=1 Tax=Paenibacillus baekrokdamisoli TaxID=1712516 RepID=A0A3G9JDH0_9BACL|nr:redoxin domain-containing protein [Paenibacillus baekrokdamisoli]MBB3069607.1 peroxiredoxin [Paenibacillus baekrokdamisoli]BBH21039.1 thiol-disulfide oxidoreductase ResA [Paenibacillus baekrokdamisoli]